MVVQRVLTHTRGFRQRAKRSAEPLILATDTALGVVRILCQIPHEFKEHWRLADKEAHGGQELERAHGSSLCFGRANHRAYRQASAEERAWLRHDQIGLEILPAKRGGIEIRKYQSVCRVGQRWRIARLILPGLKMSRLGWSDTEQDSQNF